MSLESLDLREVESAIEGILFASGEPLAIDRICLALDLDRPTAEQVLQKLGDYYAFERRGIRLIRMEDSYQLCSSPDYADVIRKAFEIRKTAKLSQPALEVLTIIAYYQPTTRAYVDQVRGVDSSYTVGLLLERELIEECGRLAVPGRPIQYRTTQNFLRAFGLSSLEELPELPNSSQEGSQMTLELESSLARLREAEQEGRPAAAIDAIALLESGFGAKCDATVAVVAPAELRVRRIMAREGIPEDYARKRVNAQKPESFFRESCDYVLENNEDDTPETFGARALALFLTILE